MTLAAMIASGVPSAYYPHLPPELTRPLPQLFAVLISHDYAPHNAAAWLGVYGNLSMLPLAFAGVAALLLCTRAMPGWRARGLVLAPALLVAAACSAPLWSRPLLEPDVPEAVAFVTRRYGPQGHDQAARLVAQLRGQQAVRDEDLRRLADLYRAEGRNMEATRALRGRF
jgi:hypothetical protein